MFVGGWVGGWVGGCVYVCVYIHACMHAHIQVIQMEADHLSVEELRKVMVRFACHGYKMRTFGGDLVAYLPALES
jgi:hypothetical protein